MEYGNKSIRSERLYLYQGFDPATVNLPPFSNQLDMPMGIVNQRDADLLFLWQMVDFGLFTLMLLIYDLNDLPF